MIENDDKIIRELPLYEISANVDVGDEDEYVPWEIHLPIDKSLPSNTVMKHNLSKDSIVLHFVIKYSSEEGINKY